MKYIKSFADTSAMNEFIENTTENGYYLLRDESKTGQDRINYVKINNRSEFNIEAIANSTVKWTMQGGTMEYSLDGGDSWTNYTYNTDIQLPQGTKIYIRRKENTVLTGYVGLIFTMDGSVNLAGNLYSLISSDYETLTDLSGWSGLLFYYTFNTLTAIVNAKNLKMHATVLGDMTYGSMFTRCSNMITAPELPALTIPSNKTYELIFRLTAITEVKCLLTNPDMLKGTSYAWLNGVPANGTFYKKRGVTWSTGEDAIPNGWTVVEVDE